MEQKDLPREQDDCVKMIMRRKYQQEYQEQGNIEGVQDINKQHPVINPTTTREGQTPQCP